MCGFVVAGTGVLEEDDEDTGAMLVDPADLVEADDVPVVVDAPELSVAELEVELCAELYVELRLELELAVVLMLEVEECSGVVADTGVDPVALDVGCEGDDTAELVLVAEIELEVEPDGIPTGEIGDPPSQEPL